MWPLLLAGLSAAQQYGQADTARQQEQVNNQLAAEKERTSWVTGRGGNPTFNSQDPMGAALNGAIQGGLSGLSFQQQGGIGSNPMASESAMLKNKSLGGESIYSKLQDPGFKKMVQGSMWDQINMQPQDIASMQLQNNFRY